MSAKRARCGCPEYHKRRWCPACYGTRQLPPDMDLVAACVYACEGMDDPVAEVQAMRELLAFSERDGIQVDGLLPYERIQSADLFKSMRLRKGEHLLMLQPFGWHLDGKHIPNAAEQFSRDSVCAEHKWVVVQSFGPYIAIVRNR